MLRLLGVTGALLLLLACTDETVAPPVAPTETVVPAPGTTPVVPVTPGNLADEEMTTPVRGRTNIDYHYDVKTYGPQVTKLLYELQQNYWYVHNLLHMSDKNHNKRWRGTWFHFNEDGTYESGMYDQTGNGGTWEFDPVNGFIHLQAKDFDKRGEFRIKMGESGTVMVWEGTRRYDQTPVQGKLEKYNRIGDYKPPGSR